MAGILFLRDIDVDIQMRCRACGHEGLLARGDLERRFGPSYPVLSIAPHYRCSRCHSKDVESSPGPQAAPPPGLDTARDEDTVEAGIAALQGLLDAVRGGHSQSGPPHPGPHPGKDSIEEDEDGVIDLMPQLRAAEVAPDDEDEGDGEKAEGDDAGDDLFERTMAALRAVARPEPEPEPEPEPDTVAAEDEDVPFDRSLAALRDLIGDEALDEDAPASEPPGPPAAPPAPDPRAVIAELLEEEEEREPIFRPRASAPPPSASEMEMSLAALRALVEKAAEDGPEPEPEPEPEMEPEPEPEEPEPARARLQPAVHTDDEPFDETIAALRSLIADRHRDADDEPPPEEDERSDEEPEELDDISDAEILSFAIRDPELAPADDAGDAGHAESAAPAMPEVEEEEEPAPPPPPSPPPPAKTSHLSETLAKLRGMLELDRPDKNGDHRHGGHRHEEDRPRRR